MNFGRDFWDTDGPMAEGPSIGVVANPDDADEIVRLLEASGAPVLWVGDGGDDTLDRFEREPPDVIVLSAFLARGDARSLASALRDTRSVPIVLVGERDGPVRNALDALDFEVDRFVGRPLSAKAITFAIKAARSEVAGVAEVSREATPPPALERRLEEFTDTAIQSFLDDAMASLPDAAPNAIEPEPSSGPVREETIILADGGASAAAPAAPAAPEPVPEPVPLERTERQSEPVFIHAPAPGGEAGDFGRELREKMSRMAERLFPGHREAAHALQSGVSTDPHTEIDLNALGVDTVVGSRSVERDNPFAGLATADTYADPGTASSSDSDSDPALQGEIVRDDTGTGPRELAMADTGGATTRRRRPSGPPAARGELDAEEDIATLLARAHRERLTGRMTLRRGREEKTIHFDAGRPVFATSNLPHDRMGDLLYREGKITREQHAASRELVAESGRRMGEVLVEKGFLKRRELLPAVRRHIEDIIYSLFSWDSGEWATTPGDSAPGEKIRLSRHPAALVVEGIRRKYGLDALEQRLGPPTAVVSLVDGRDTAELLKEIDLTPIERRAVDKLVGEATLAQVAATSGLDVLTLSQLAFGLVALGVAEVVGGGTGGGTGVWDSGGRAPSLVGATDLAIDRQRLLAKHAHVVEADYFMLLGVRRDATAFEIKRAYEAARRDYAAETFPSEVRRELSTEIDEINALLEEAFLVLSDDHMRTAYRTNLREQ